MAVGSLNSTFDYSSMQVIQSVQNKERLQRQQQADKAGSAVQDTAASFKSTDSLNKAKDPAINRAQRQRQQQSQAGAQQQSRALRADESQSVPGPEEQLKQYQAETTALNADRRPQSKALAAYGAVASQSQREGLRRYFSFSAYA